MDSKLPEGQGRTEFCDCKHLVASLWQNKCKDLLLLEIWVPGDQSRAPFYLPLAIVLGALRMLVVAVEVRPSLSACSPGLGLLGPLVAAKQ